MIKRKIPLKQIQQQADGRGLAFLHNYQIIKGYEYGRMVNWLSKSQIRTTRGVRKTWSRRNRRDLLTRCPDSQTIKLEGLGWKIPCIFLQKQTIWEQICTKIGQS